MERYSDETPVTDASTLPVKAALSEPRINKLERPRWSVLEQKKRVKKLEGCLLLFRSISSRYLHPRWAVRMLLMEEDITLDWIWCEGFFIEE
ncbi:hypothetical protein AVEN_5747-1 [Araneus ventricosus]|uniref:Uncharacterized protein n=1 Tax=Araneus ventricosus TaxID=182803 RepID=A0A4Y2DZ05_ARAVE|nr:hypothetical protein AVEN_5747-1 [Araneus ventricosus]